MVERGTDQADGLRRMFGGVRTRVLEIVSGTEGVGCTSVAVNLGAALARAGRSTLLIDFVQDPSASRVHEYLGMPHAGDQRPRIVGKGYDVMSLAHRQWMQTGPLSASTLGTGSAMPHEAAAHDWVLVNGSSVEPVVASDDGSRDVLLVLSNAAQSITAAYALIKRMSASDQRCRYRVLVNRVHSEAAAQKLFRSLAQVARGFLDIQLAPIGFIPADLAVERAAAEGVSVFEHDSMSAAAQAFGRLADAIGHWAPTRPLYADPTPALAVAAGAS